MLQRLLLAAASGAAIWLAFPGYDLWPLAVVGTAALALATRGAGIWRGAVLGLLAGLTLFAPLLSWSGVYVGVLPWAALSVLQALYVAGLGAVCGWLQRDRVRPVVVALSWVTCELLRSTTPFGGFPWGRLAFSQADSPLLGAAALVGTPGLTFLVALAGGLLAAGVSSLQAGGVRRRAGLGALAGVAVCLLLPTTVPRPVDGEPVQVLAVQGNVPRLGLDFNAQRRAVLDNHVSSTVRAAQDVADGVLDQPDVVLWPENSSDIDPVRNADAAALIQGAVDTIAAPVVVGAVLRRDDDRNSNAALLYVPGEGITDRYLKLRPVPFAEYIPYRSFFRAITDTVDLVPRDFAAGEEVGVLDVPLREGGALPLGVAICFEVVVDDLMRATVLEGAEVVLVPTNNATFGLTDESVQQLAASRVKAVELGRSVVHVSTVGVSALILPDGSTGRRTELFTQDILSGELPRRTELTVAVRLGPWPERAAAVALLALVVAGVRERRSAAVPDPRARLSEPLLTTDRTP